MVCRYHILFTFSSFGEHLCCCHLMAIMNTTTRYMDYKYLFEFLPSILLRLNLEMELLDHMVIPCLISWGIAIPFSIAGTSCYTPTSDNSRVQIFPHPSNMCYFWFSFFCLWIAIQWMGALIFCPLSAPSLSPYGSGLVIMKDCVEWGWTSQRCWGCTGGCWASLQPVGRTRGDGIYYLQLSPETVLRGS